MGEALSRQERWKLREGVRWKAHRAAYMRQYRKTGSLMGLASKSARVSKVVIRLVRKVDG